MNTPSGDISSPDSVRPYATAPAPGVATAYVLAALGLLLLLLVVLSQVFPATSTAAAAAAPAVGSVPGQAGQDSASRNQPRVQLFQVSGPPVRVVSAARDYQPAYTATATPSSTPTAWRTPTSTPELGGAASLDTLAGTAVPLLLIDVHGQFFANPDNSQDFNIGPSATPPTPLFEQDFPLIDFNPPIIAHVPCIPTPYVYSSTHPFTDVILNAPGLPCAYQTAGAVVSGTPVILAPTPNTPFHAVYTGQLYVGEAGAVTFDFWSDDGWILGIGPEAYVTGTPPQPTYTAGVVVPPWPATGTPPPHSPFYNYLVVGRADDLHGPGGENLTVNFPAAGYYPFELDYTECCQDPLTLVMGSDGIPILQGPSVTVTPTFTCVPGPYWCGGSGEDPYGANSLAAIAAIDSADVWAGGSHVDLTPGSGHTLLEHWDGQRWIIPRIPSTRHRSDQRVGGRRRTRPRCGRRATQALSVGTARRGAHRTPQRRASRHWPHARRTTCTLPAARWCNGGRGARGHK